MFLKNRLKLKNQKYFLIKKPKKLKALGKKVTQKDIKEAIFWARKK
jgi:hypothetical protein